MAKRSTSLVLLTLLNALVPIAVTYALLQVLFVTLLVDVQNQFPQGGPAAMIAFLGTVLIYVVLITPLLSVLLVRCIYYLVRRFTPYFKKLSAFRHLLVGMLAAPAVLFFVMVLQLLNLVLSSDYATRASFNFYQVLLVIVVPLFAIVVFGMWHLLVIVLVRLFKIIRWQLAMRR